MNDQQRASRIALESVRARSQRIRVGVMGLCGILLIVGLASAMMTRLTESVEKAPASAARVGVPGATNSAAPVEPLIELGVSPGQPEEAGVPGPAPVPAPVQAQPAGTAPAPVPVQ